VIEEAEAMLRLAAEVERTLWIIPGVALLTESCPVNPG